MTLQQLNYIVAVDHYRHFGDAANACGVTQSTLSSMIQKLEIELDVTIFDRSSQPVKPTSLGEELINQAKIVLYNASQLKEIVHLEKKLGQGKIRLGIIPTVAPYILPSLFKQMLTKHPQVELEVSEMRTVRLIKKLERAELDMALLATPLNKPNLLEIPLYYEKFYAYISPTHPLFSQEAVASSDLTDDQMWVLKEGHCLRDQVFNFCKTESHYLPMYEAGSIDTLVRIVDLNGGYTIIPQLHIDLLKKCQKRNIRKLKSPEPVREISLVVRNDFVKERLLNLIIDQVKELIPPEMIDERLKKFTIKL